MADPERPAIRATSADTGVWPLLRSERSWSSWRLGIALATAAAATWCYLIGEYAGYYLNFFQGSLALTAGSMIGMLLVLLAAGRPVCASASNRWPPPSRSSARRGG